MIWREQKQNMHIGSKNMSLEEISMAPNSIRTNDATGSTWGTVGKVGADFFDFLAKNCPIAEDYMFFEQQVHLCPRLKEKMFFFQHHQIGLIFSTLACYKVFLCDFLVIFSDYSVRGLVLQRRQIFLWELAKCKKTAIFSTVLILSFPGWD